MWGKVLVLMAALTAGPAAAQVAGLPAGDICARGAVAGPVPMRHLFRLEARTLRQAAQEATDWTPGPDGSYPVAAEAPALRDALAAREAALPPTLRDLPYLILLAEIETDPDGAIHTLTQGAESLIAARLLDAMDRNRLTAEARLYREGIGLFPDWGSLPADRARQTLDDSGEGGDQALVDALSDVAFRWPPPGGRALAAAEALVASDPDTAAAYAARLAGLTEDDRLAWLLERLWRDCVGDGWWTEEEADRAFLSGGSVQAALVMMDAFLADTSDGGLDAYFFGASATMAPKLALVLDLRGLTASAATLREAMALFGPDFPRDTDARMRAMQDFSAEQHDLMAALTAQTDAAAIEADMRQLARDAGLLPD